MQALLFSHNFATGRKITITINRHENALPTLKSSMQCAEMTSAELNEFEAWRGTVLIDVPNMLTVGERIAIAEHGRRTLRKAFSQP